MCCAKLACVEFILNWYNFKLKHQVQIGLVSETYALLKTLAGLLLMRSQSLQTWEIEWLFFIVGSMLSPWLKGTIMIIELSNPKHYSHGIRKAWINWRWKGWQRLFILTHPFIGTLIEGSKKLRFWTNSLFEACLATIAWSLLSRRDFSCSTVETGDLRRSMSVI